jgi:hypothetical protein
MQTDKQKRMCFANLLGKINNFAFVDKDWQPQTQGSLTR